MHASKPRFIRLFARLRALIAQERTLVSGIAGVAGLKLLAIGLAMINTFVVARLLGVADFGKYSFAYALASLLALPLLQGLPTLVLREVARETGQARTQKTVLLLRFADRLVLAVGIALGLTGIGLITLRHSQGGAIEPLLVLAALALPLVTVTCLVRSAVTRAHGFAVQGQLPDMIARPLLFLCLLASLWLAPDQRSPGFAMSLHVAAAFAALMLAINLMPPKQAAPSYDKRDISTWAWLKALLPLSTVSGMQLIISQIDTIALGIFATDADVGVYRIAVALALQVSFVLTVVNLVAAPRFARLYHANRLDELKRLNRTGALAATIAGGILVGAYWLFGGALIELTVGSSFLPAFAPLMILSFAHLATLWAGTTNVLLNMIGRERDVLMAAAVAVIVSAGMNILLVPTYGTIGAACASALGLFAWRGMLSWFMARHFAEATLIGVK